ncbi:membrane protein [Candidatus Xenohaliotis californiensis]|uniref:Membrane protein n=1 Tax=Candidatus Xenohaliotis californiensis TaxID=84677 RepID=A0ABM9NA86_9RICK|nr:membrane protein [Candidatus Xenohaliotis californiensis]
MQKLFKCFYKSAHDLIQHDGVEYAGYLSFLIILSIFPALILIVSLIGLIVRITNVGNDIQSLMSALFIDNELGDLLAILKPQLLTIISTPPQSILGIAIVGMIWTSSSTIETFRVILNRAYRVKSPPHYLIRRLTSILQFLFIVTAIALAIIVGSLLGITVKRIDAGIVKHVIKNNLTAQYFITIIITMLGILWLYTIVPNKKQKIVNVLPGTLLVTCLLTVTAKILTFYIKKFSQIGSIYGSLEGVIIALIFFYAINLCIIYGAEFNYNIQQA